MSRGKGRRRRTDDPRKAGGKLIDAGGPTSRNAVLFDARRAVLVEQFEIAVAHRTSNGAPMPDAVAMVARGRMNRPPDDAASRHAPAEPIEHLHLLTWELAAELVVEIQALAARDGYNLTPLLRKRWAELEREGLTSRVG